MSATERRAALSRALALAALAATAHALGLHPALPCGLAAGATGALVGLFPRVRALVSAAALGCIYAVTVLPARLVLALLRVDPLRAPRQPLQGSFWIPRTPDRPAPSSYTRMR